MSLRKSASIVREASSELQSDKTRPNTCMHEHGWRRVYNNVFPPSYLLCASHTRPSAHYFARSLTNERRVYFIEYTICQGTSSLTEPFHSSTEDKREQPRCQWLPQTDSSPLFLPLLPPGPQAFLPTTRSLLWALWSHRKHADQARPRLMPVFHQVLP